VLRGTNLSTVGTVPYRVMRLVGTYLSRDLCDTRGYSWMPFFCGLGGGAHPDKQPRTHVERQVRSVSHGRHAEHVAHGRCI
jgi:hypothetical protein